MIKAAFQYFSTQRQFDVVILAAFLIVTTAAFAGEVRLDFKHSGRIAKDTSEYEVWARRHIPYAGGVVIGSAGVEYVGVMNDQETPITSDMVRISYADNGHITLTVSVDGKYHNFDVPIHEGLACPLARFVDRNFGPEEAKIAFTVPPAEVDSDYLSEAGLVRLDGGYIAKEFVDFGTLFRDMDLELGYASLSSDDEQKILAIANRVGVEFSDVSASWTYFSSDMLTEYVVFLPYGESKAQFGGLPFVFWPTSTTEDGDGMTSVQIWSADIYSIPSDNELSSGPPFTQYDFLSVYHAAAVLRDARKNRTASFAQFIQSACR